MTINQNIPPMVYYIRKDTINKSYYLLPAIAKYETPAKIYGKIDKFAIRFWNNYVLENTSTGVLLTGHSGSGKTECARLTCNLAIAHGIPVVAVSEITADIELISYINNLSSVVILFDEFSKVFDRVLQEKLLSMFSNLNNRKKLFIITENDKNTISEFIRNRPGRARYHIDFSRVFDSVVDMYCKDHNVSKGFFKELKDKYNSSVIFSFDHLQAIVSEHHRYPNETLDELIYILNLDILSNIEMYTIESVTKLLTGANLVFIKKTIDKKMFDAGRYFYVSINDPAAHSGEIDIHFSNTKQIYIAENYINVTVDGYIIKLVNQNTAT